MNITSHQPAFAFSLAPHEHPPTEGSRAGTLEELRATARRHWKILVLWCLFCLGAAIAYLAETPPRYVATTQLLLDPVRPSASLRSIEGGRLPIALDAAQADSHIQVLKSERLLRFVFDTLDLGRSRELAEAPPGLWARILSHLVPPTPPSEEDRRAAAFLRFMGGVNARRIGQSYAIEVSYTALDPVTATHMVDSITSAYLWDQVASARRGSEFLQTRIADLKAEEDAALDGVRRGSIPDMRFPDADARVISAAIVPTAKAFPQARIVIALAVTFALATAFCSVLAVQSLDRRIRGRRQIHRHLGLECLAELPRISDRWQRRRSLRCGALQRTDESFNRAIGAVRATLIGTGPSSRHRAIGLVSWHPGEGTTTTASGLAHVTAAASQDVVLIDGDLQGADLTQALAPDEQRGLADSLLARDPPHGLTSVRLTEHLTFVPAVGDGIRFSLDAFAGLPEMQQYISAFRDQASVVVDLPAASTSSDAQIIGRMLDGVILVVEAARTTFDEAHECIVAFRKAGVDVVGVILNHRARA